MGVEITSVTFYDPSCWACGSEDADWVAISEETRVRACDDCAPDSDSK